MGFDQFFQRHPQYSGMPPQEQLQPQMPQAQAPAPMPQEQLQPGLMEQIQSRMAQPSMLEQMVGAQGLAPVWQQALKDYQRTQNPAIRGARIGQTLFGKVVAPMMGAFGGPGEAAAGVQLINDTQEQLRYTDQQDRLARREHLAALSGLANMASNMDKTTLAEIGALIRTRQAENQALAAQSLMEKRQADILATQERLLQGQNKLEQQAWFNAEKAKEMGSRNILREKQGGLVEAKTVTEKVRPDKIKAETGFINIKSILAPQETAIRAKNAATYAEKAAGGSSKMDWRKAPAEKMAKVQRIFEESLHRGTWPDGSPVTQASAKQKAYSLKMPLPFDIKMLPP